MVEKDEHTQELNEKMKQLEQLTNNEIELNASKSTLEAHIDNLEKTLAKNEER